MSLLTNIMARNFAIIQGTNVTNRAFSRNLLTDNGAELGNAIDGTTAKAMGIEAQTLDEIINKQVKEQFCYNFF